MRKNTVRILTAAGLLGLAGTAAGQSVGVLPTLHALADGGGPIPTLLFDNNSQRFDMHAWRRDGADTPAVLAVVGWMERDGARGSMATWDGRTWELYPEIPGGGNFGRSTLFDPDGPGPAPETIYAIRMGAAPSRVVKWDGAAWVSVGSLTEPTVSSWGDLGSFDPDGDGPALPWLIHANQRVSAFVNGAWQDLGLVSSSFPHRVTSVQQFDPDGDEPGLPVLVVAGQFTAVGGVPASNIAVMRGIDWEPVTGLTPAGPAGRMSVYDFDGPGHRRPELVVPMRSVVDGATTDLVAWSGALWRRAANGTYNAPAFISYPENSAAISAPGVMEGLLAFGQFTSLAGAPVASIGLVNGATGGIEPLSTAAGAGFTSYVDSVVAVDLDGEGPENVQVFAIGPAQRSAGVSIPGVARWNGAQWQPMTGAFTHDATSPKVNGVSAVDPDGDGPARETTYIQGAFKFYGGVGGLGGANGYGDIAAFDGAVSPLGNGSNPAVANPGSVLAFDPDAAGPAQPRLMSSGLRWLEWSGSQWAPVGPATSTFKMCLHDFDGPGPNPPRALVGTFISQGGVLSYDGQSVSPVGVTEHLGASGNVRALLSHDVDGDGPAAPLLYAGGLSLLSNVMVYDGLDWRPVGERITWTVRALALMDPDGSGPRDPEVFAGGSQGVMSWDGSVWHAYPGLPTGADVQALVVFDPDGAGPEAPTLIAAGTAGLAVGFVRRWDASADVWAPLPDVNSDFTQYVLALGVEHPFGPGGPERLALGMQDLGNLNDGSGSYGAVLRYTDLGRAWLTEEPADAAAEPGASVEFSARVQRAYAQAGAVYEWRRNGEPIPGSQGVFSVGCETATLILAGVAEPDEGVYDLAVVNAAGVSISRPAVLTVGAACPADFNRDQFLDFFDYDDFVGCFESGACPPGATADYNGDGFTDFFDYDDFVAAFETGC